MMIWSFLPIFTKIFLLYSFLKIIVRLAMVIFCRKVIINKPVILKTKGPMLLACNHPNSFLDGVILDTLFDQPLYSLARGDVFKKTFYSKLLTALKLLPVFRTSEGTGNLTANYDTFENCKEIFRKEGIVIIFSEGKCINEWHLRPLKKGTARLAIKTWEANIPLKVLPVGINYSSFRRFGKNMLINFGDTITKEDISLSAAEGLRHQSFNNKLQQQLEQLVFEIPKTDKQKQEELLAIKTSLFKKIFLFIPAIIGLIVHAPLYLPVKRFTLTRTNNNDHYDSILTGILVIAYPFYLLLLTLIVFFFTKSGSVFLLWLILPFTAWSYVQIKPQLDK